MSKRTLNINGMHCAACVSKVEKKLAGMDDVSNVTVNLATGTASFDVNSEIDSAKLIHAIDQIGYSVQTQAAQFSVEDMECASCVTNLERALDKADGIIDVSINLAQKTVSANYLTGFTDTNQISDIITATGYTGKIIDQSAPGLSPEETHLQNYRTYLRNFILAVIGTLAIMVIPHVAILGNGLVAWLQASITAFIILLPARTFFTRAARMAKYRSADMNTLIALGAGTAFAYSLFTISATDFLGIKLAAHQLHFNTAAMILSFILLGRTLEAKSKSRASYAIGSLLRLTPDQAHRLDGDHVSDVSTAELTEGDIVIVRSGEAIPIDGTILDGTPSVNESMLTGESMPVDKKAGDPVYGGTLNSLNSFKIKVTNTGADTALAGIIRMIEQAQGSKAPIQQLADKIASIFVPIVLGISVLTFITWYMFGSDPLNQALTSAVAVLVIACPCAMGLATPTAVMVATGSAGKRGIVFKGGGILEECAKIDIVVLDKTGTITVGKPLVTKVILSEEFTESEILQLSASAEQNSTHPIAQAIVAYAAENGIKATETTDFHEFAGGGIEAIIGDRNIRIGKPEWLKGTQSDWKIPEEETGTIVGLQVEAQLAGWFIIKDTIRPDVGKVVRSLNGMGLRTVMLTGDRESVAKAISDEAGISEFKSDLKPADKVAHIQALIESGSKVCMIGDGINDAPALKTANVGIAIGAGSDTAIESADLILMSDDLQGVVDAFKISRRSLKIIKQNLFWAFFYNSIGIPLAAGVLYPFTGFTIPPMFAAAAMALSSVSVVTNSLRLRKI